MNTSLCSARTDSHAACASAETDSSNLRGGCCPVPVLCSVPQETFDRLASSQLQYLHDGLVDMQPENAPHFHLTLQPSSRLTLQLAPSVGTYEVSVDGGQQRLILFSPASGIYKYEWNEVKEAWVGEHDQHFLVELLVRELLKYCQGVPKL